LKNIVFKVGDFILLKRNDRCPADIIICESKDKLCQVDSKFVNGESRCSIKNSLNQTSCKFLL